MNSRLQSHLLFLCLLCVACAASVGCTSFPLYADSRWIVDSFGHRVKLSCGNWPSHLEPLLAEGLGKQPVDVISKKIGAMGFNCVRLTYPIFMLTKPTMSNMTVRSSFQALNLFESIGGLIVNNPTILNLTVIEAFERVVINLGENNIMVILDNHVSKPGWCCADTDGNGFFGDAYFNPNEWIQGLSKMATLFNGVKNVVGMSLRNELRGPRQNVNLWYKYMQKGAEAVHAANPNVLVILSGLQFDNDLSFLSKKQVHLSFSYKLVFEFHWYAFSNPKTWSNENLNDVCGRITGAVHNKSGFLLSQGYPLILSEFGIDQRGGNSDDNRYFDCAMGILADWDLDWAIWALQGSYYLRQGTFGLNEVYGMFTWDWSGVRNSTYLKKIQSIQQPFQGPGLSHLQPYKIIFHPFTGLCVLVKKGKTRLELGPCTESGAWNYTAQETLEMQSSGQCLSASGARQAAGLGGCNDGGSSTRWEMISKSKMHFSTNYENSSLCLDASGRKIVTNPCKCLAEDKDCEPQSQWFRLITSTRSIMQ